ncbi:MAG: BspA family leucine-rich repeat surface protein [Nanoarchaeota archaeon]|nr:BspA family leucine-rich repeat surface protein [Nanoarchaeota archaeon]
MGNNKAFNLFIIIILLGTSFLGIMGAFETPIIEITSADHLNPEKEFIENIYDSVREKDGVWFSVPDEDYVRIVFEEDLTSNRDITIYARGSGTVEVYKKDLHERIMEFSIEGENRYKKYLTNMGGEEDAFDLKFLGDIEVDYIVDPVEDEFRSVWNTTISGVSNSTTITLPLESTGTYEFTVDWGDGVNTTVTSWDSANKTHTYATGGVYNVNISGTIQGWRFNNGGDKTKITDISQWGSLRVGNSNGYFYGASNLDVTATDALDLTGTTTLESMFRAATSFNGNISNWDVSNITNMITLFFSATSFNQDLSDWDMGNVVFMLNMFRSATSFNGSLSNWDTGSVTDMGSVFRDATSFNGNVSNWNTSNVLDMNFMFRSTPFNQDISNWDTGKVTRMDFMFQGATSFNQDISNWDTGKVTRMDFMFQNAQAFNQDIDNWNVSGVTLMSDTFRDAVSFNQDLSNWDTGKVTTMFEMFRGATSFDQNLGDWNVSSVTSMGSMFLGAGLSTSNYDKLLIEWADLSPNLQSSVSFDAGSSQYTVGVPNQSRETLVNTHSWTITDSGGIADTVAPLLDIISPENITYINTSILTNLSSYDVNIDKTWYNWDGTNTTYTNSLNITFSEGANTLYAWANDTYGNENSTNITFFVNMTAPYFTTIPENATLEYGESLNVIFEATDENVFDSYYLGNWTDTFSINSTGGLNNISELSAGTYVINVSINDSVGNTNMTWYQVDVEDTIAPYFTTIPADGNITYGTSWAGAQFEATDVVGFDSYYVNDTTNFQINSTGFLNWTSALNAGYYPVNVTINDTSGNINYTAYNLNISAKDIEITADNKEKDYGDSDPALTYTVTSGGLVYDDTFTGSLTRSSSETVGSYDITQGTLTIENLGSYDLTFVPGTFTINKATPTLNVGAENVTYPSNLTILANETNSGDSDVNYTLYVNGTFETYGSDINVQQNRSAGTYTLVYNTTGGENYTSASEIIVREVSKISSEVLTYLNNSRSNITIERYTSIYLNSTLNPGDGEITLYVNGGANQSGNSPLSVLYKFDEEGSFNITTSYSEAENYTSAYETWWVIVTADVTDPSVTLVSPEDEIVLGGGDQTFTCSATDSAGLSSIGLYHNSTGTWHLNATTSVTGTSNETSFAIQGFNFATFVWNCEAIDSNSLTDFAAENFTVTTVADNTAPFINSESVTSDLTSGETATVRANITDNSAISLVWFSLNDTDGNLANYTMSREGSTDFYNNSLEVGKNGTWYFKVYANDSAENLNNSLPWTAFNVSKPSAVSQNETYPTSALPSSSVTIAADLNATDLLKEVNVSLSVPSGFQFPFTSYPQNQSKGNFSAGEIKTARWFVYLPTNETTHTFNITWTDEYNNTFQQDSKQIVATYDATNLTNTTHVNIITFPELESGAVLESEVYVRDINGELVNADSVRISLYDPSDNLIVDDVNITSQLETGRYFYNYTTPSAPTGQWTIVANVTREGNSFIDREYFRVTGGPFDVRDITITDSTIPSLGISVILENMGDGVTDIVVDWNLTREDTGELLDSGQDTIGVSGQQTHTISPSTTYVGESRITFLGTWSSTEKAGAYEIFTTASAPAETTSSGSGNSGSAGDVITGKTIYEAKDEETEEGTVQRLRDGEKVKFNIIRDKIVQGHSLEIIDLQHDRATITVYSQPITILLYVSEDKKLDLDSDGYYDLYVKLEDIENNRAHVYIQSVYEEIVGAGMEEKGRDEIEKAPEREDPSTTSKISSPEFWILILLIFILYLMVRKEKRVRKTSIKSSVKSLLNARNIIASLLIGIVSASLWFNISTKDIFSRTLGFFREMNLANYIVSIDWKIVLVGLIILALIGIIYKINKNRQNMKIQGHDHRKYRAKVRNNLNKIRSKKVLSVFLSLVIITILFSSGEGITGFVTGNLDLGENNAGLLGLVLIVAILCLLGGIYKNRISKMLHKEKKEYILRNSVMGLINKDVYSEEGVYIGSIREIILKENIIYGLKIILDRRHKRKKKEVVIRYKRVLGVGEIVIIEDGIFEGLDKHQKI